MMFQSLFLAALAIGADNPYRVVEANPFTVQTVITPAKSDGFYIQWADGSYAYPGSSVLDRPQTQTIFVVGPWHNNREAIYATLQSPTRQQIEAALAQARETWATAKGVSQSARPFVWPLPSAGETVDHDLTRRGPWPKGFEFPEGMNRYKRAGYSQKLFGITGDPVDKIEPVHRHDLPNKDWLQSGGMLGITDFRSDLYRNSVAERPYVAVEKIIVNNGGDITRYNQFGQVIAIDRGMATQPQDGYVARYSDGSRFLDVLSNSKTGAVFEIRQRLKEEGRWRNSVVFEDERERPAGYTGLTKSCTSCHAQAGTGGYAVGLTPGSDQTLSIGFKALENQ